MGVGSGLHTSASRQSTYTKGMGDAQPKTNWIHKLCQRHPYARAGRVALEPASTALPNTRKNLSTISQGGVREDVGN